VFGYGFYGPYGGPGYYGPYEPYNNAGTVKINSKTTDAQVFVNGSFAGTVKDNKTMHLRQGKYNIEIRHAGETTFSESVYVTAGKTLHITPSV
jgi:PEGA domain-containing protein